MRGDVNRMPKIYNERQTMRFGFNIPAGNKDMVFKATLAYSDYPASVGSNWNLVNDLDLTVTTQDGKTYYPNGRTDPDTVNNVEQVVLKGISGRVVVAVSASAMPVGPQPFSIVVRGGFDRVLAGFDTEEEVKSGLSQPVKLGLIGAGSGLGVLLVAAVYLKSRRSVPIASGTVPRGAVVVMEDDVQYD